MVFGELDDAFAAARRVHAIHARITGTIPVTVGRWRAGTRYHANDAEALRWVHATLVDTVLVVRDRLGPAMPPATRDAYVVEMNRVAKMFGIPRALLPDGHAAHASYMAEMLDALAVAPPAREMATFLVGRGGDAQPPLGRLVEALTVSMLPPRLSRELGLAESRLVGAAARAATSLAAPMYRRLPHELVAIPALSAARRRLAGRPPSRIAAWTERRLFGLGRRVTG
jgi:uncharacterized protein (DUF2236 family)